MWLNGLCSVVAILGVLIMAGHTRINHVPCSEMYYKKQTPYHNHVNRAIEKATSPKDLQKVIYRLTAKWKNEYMPYVPRDIREDLNGLIWDIVAVQFDVEELKDEC